MVYLSGPRGIRTHNIQFLRLTPLPGWARGPSAPFAEHQGLDVRVRSYCRVSTGRFCHARANLPSKCFSWDSNPDCAVFEAAASANCAREALRMLLEHHRTLGRVLHKSIILAWRIRIHILRWFLVGGGVGVTATSARQTAYAGSSTPPPSTLPKKRSGWRGSTASVFALP